MADIRKQLRCVIVDPFDQNKSLCTGILVDVPAGLTRNQAQDFVTGVIAGEVRRYAAAEALGLGPYDQNTNWQEIVT